MTGQVALHQDSIADKAVSIYKKMLRHPTYKWLLLILGLPLSIILIPIFRYFSAKSGYARLKESTVQELTQSGLPAQLLQEAREQVRRKHQFFGQSVNEKALEQEAKAWADTKFSNAVDQRMQLQQHTAEPFTFDHAFQWFIMHPARFALSIIIAFPMYVLMLIYSNPYVKYIIERLVMAVLVILGVSVLVFTILYISPMDPASNLLGETATEEQIASFNQLYGLDQPYLVQLWDTLRGIVTLDLGKSFAGNELVSTAIANKFPITLTLTVIATILAVLIALPIGIISATKPNSVFDYSFMFIALLGLSIPNFWLGLIFILNFSIKLSWLPATYSPGNWMSAIMPVIVLGTALMASVARMTRSSMLEVIHEDYIITARAKGLKSRHVLWKHAIGNALIPIITVIGLLFGSMLGGAAVTEKVFNISGIGSYIVDRQFIPDIPSIMGGVVYTAITISIVNVIVDLLYAFLDPRIRSKMKQY